MGGRRFGASVIIKDNMVFGIKENEDAVTDKVQGDDEMLSQEAKKAGDRNCEFWLEFENKARLHIAMIEPAEAAKELIPPQKNEERARTGMKRAEFGSEAALDSLDPPEGAQPASS